MLIVILGETGNRKRLRTKWKNYGIISELRIFNRTVNKFTCCVRILVSNCLQYVVAFGNRQFECNAIGTNIAVLRRNLDSRSLIKRSSHIFNTLFRFSLKAYHVVNRGIIITPVLAQFNFKLGCIDILVHVHDCQTLQRGVARLGYGEVDGVCLSCTIFGFHKNSSCFVYFTVIDSNNLRIVRFHRIDSRNSLCQTRQQISVTIGCRFKVCEVGITTANFALLFGIGEETQAIKLSDSRLSDGVTDFVRCLSAAFSRYVQLGTFGVVVLNNNRLCSVLLLITNFETVHHLVGCTRQVVIKRIRVVVFNFQSVDSNRLQRHIRLLSEVDIDGVRFGGKTVC